MRRDEPVAGSADARDLAIECLMTEVRRLEAELAQRAIDLEGYRAALRAAVHLLHERATEARRRQRERTA